MANSDRFLDRAAELALASVAAGGGPFGAVVVQGGRLVGEGANQVTLARDPTAHAEVQAIRAACRTLGTHDLAGAELYASCEPCPMCLGAIYWAHVGRVVYASDRHDAAAAGFDDLWFYEELARPLAQRRVAFEQRANARARAAFEAWLAKPDKQPY